MVSGNDLNWIVLRKSFVVFIKKQQIWFGGIHMNLLWQRLAYEQGIISISSHTFLWQCSNLLLAPGIQVLLELRLEELKNLRSYWSKSIIKDSSWEAAEVDANILAGEIIRRCLILLNVQINSFIDYLVGLRPLRPFTFIYISVPTTSSEIFHMIKHCSTQRAHQ